MLPVENLLQGGGGWIALGKHGNDDVSSKRLAGRDLVTDLESDFRRDGMVLLEESFDGKDQASSIEHRASSIENQASKNQESSIKHLALLDSSI